jgi:signal transduction histidine kinase
MGRIEITDTDDIWRIISSREGVVHTDAFYDLTEAYSDNTDHNNTSYFYSILRKLERYIVEGLNWDSSSEKWHEINDKILSNKNSFIHEKFRIPEKDKNVQVISALQDIIRQGTKPEDIVSLELDESLIKMLSEQEAARTEEFLREFNTFADNFDTDSQIDSKVKLKTFLKNAESLLSTLYNERNAAREEAKQTKKQLNRVKKDKDVLRDENLFLKAQKSRDIDDVINLHHQVITWGQIISKNCDTVLSRAKSKGSLNQNDLLNTVGRIKLQAHKILKVAKLATNANFRVKAVAIENNIIKFIHDYIAEISRIKLFRDIELKFNTNAELKFITRFTPIELTILIDSLISNSRKASANLFVISVRPYDLDSIEIIFDDNGKGISPDVHDTESIFVRGYTTTNGSGIGLHHARSIAESMGGSLEVIHSKLGGFALIMRLTHEA